MVKVKIYDRGFGTVQSGYLEAGGTYELSEQLADYICDRMKAGERVSKAKSTKKKAAKK